MEHISLMLSSPVQAWSEVSLISEVSLTVKILAALVSPIGDK